MTMTTDRSIPGRVSVSFGLRRNGVLTREPVWGDRLGPDGLPEKVGVGINVSAMGTLDPEESRALAALIVEEANAIDAEAGSVTSTFTGSTQWNAEADRADAERWKRAGEEYRAKSGRDRP